jgi:type IV pilus assembly protein PilW
MKLVQSRTFKAMNPRQAGLTLVELMVALVVGLAVIVAALSTYLSSGSSSRINSQITQMSEDANAALSLLRTHIAMAGYSHPIGLLATGELSKAYSGPAIFGCQNGLDQASTGQYLGGPNGTTLTCNSGNPSTAETLIVLYEVDSSNSIPTKTSPGTDCLGNGALQINDSAGNPYYYLAENRFFLDPSSGSLSCLGNGNTSPQPVVDNIADFYVLYGVAGTDKSSGLPLKVAQQYLTASQVGDMAAGKWNQVVSVRVCVVVRSEDDALDAPMASYTDCHGQQQTPTTWGTPAKPDRRSYRRFTSTVALKNRIS